MKNLSFIKTVFILILTVSFQFLTFNSFGQPPESFSYQAIVRDNTGNIVANKAVKFRIAILQASASGTEIYSETHVITTNNYGLANLSIGKGTVLSGTFKSINWGSYNYYIKVGFDPNSGNNFTTFGTSQLLSVPYALHAKSVEIDKVNDADADPANEIQALSINGTNLTLSKGGGTVALPSSGGGGDNWGTQAVVTDASLTGNGTTSTPLKIAQRSATNGQILKWNGSSWIPASDDTGTGLILPYSETDPTPYLPSLEVIKSANGIAITGNNTLSSGSSIGVSGISSSSSGTGIQGSSVSSTGYTYGVRGNAFSPNGSGVYGTGNVNGVFGEATATTGDQYGVKGIAHSSNGIGVYGSALMLGILGESEYTSGSNASGVVGQDKSTNGKNYGVSGISWSTSGTGVYGYTSSATGTTYGVSGKAASGNGIGVFGEATANSGNSVGVKGISSSDIGIGVSGEGYYGVVGKSTSAYGLAVKGENRATTGNAIGIFGSSDSETGSGVLGYAYSSTGSNRAVSGRTYSSTGYSGYFEGPRFYVQGMVGIGTTSPASGLHLKAYGFPNSFMYIESDAGQDAGFRLYEGATAKWHIFNNSSAGGLQIYNSAVQTAIFAKQSNSYVGIGTTNPTYPLHVNGDAAKTSGTTAWVISSDRRLKNILGNYEKGLAEIVALQPVKFKYKDDNPRQLPSDTELVGFIAQDVQKVFPEAIKEGDDGYLDFNIHSINVALVNAIKELKAENEELKAEIKDIKAANQRMNSRIDQIEAMFNTSASK